MDRQDSVVLPYEFDSSGTPALIVRGVLGLLFLVVVPGILYSLVVSRSVAAAAQLLIVGGVVVYFGRLFLRNLETARGTITQGVVVVQPGSLYGIRLAGPAAVPGAAVRVGAGGAHSRPRGGSGPTPRAGAIDRPEGDAGHSGRANRAGRGAAVGTWPGRRARPALRGGGCALLGSAAAGSHGRGVWRQRPWDHHSPRTDPWRSPPCEAGGLGMILRRVSSDDGA